jgi:hypothetical protein
VLHSSPNNAACQERPILFISSSRDSVGRKATLPALILIMLWLHRSTNTVQATKPMIFLVAALTGVIE